MAPYLTFVGNGTIDSGTATWYTTTTSTSTNASDVSYIHRTWILEPVPETPAERTARLALEEQAVAEQRRLEQEHRETEETAEGLAKLFLPPSVYQALKGGGSVAVASRRDPSLTYHFGANREMVMVKRGDKRLLRLCFHPQEAVPLWDEVLGRWLLLNGDERTVWERANTHPEWLDSIQRAQLKAAMVAEAVLA